MKTLPRFLTSVALSAFTFSPALLRAQDGPPPPDSQFQGAPPDQGQVADDQTDDQGVSFQTFYDQLGDQGQWVQTDDYGYVFQPTVSDPDWAPYTDGHWVYADVGWTWVSDESWGWATYHYGRWCNIEGTGWCWVPGYRWAPAWVSWRYGGGYCGWAPLPPETFVGAEYGNGGNVGVGFHFGGDVDVNFNIGPGCYNFVRVGDFGSRNYRGHYLDRGHNYTVINNTTNITNINVTNFNDSRGGGNGGRGGRGGNFRGVNVGGPRLAEINAQSREHVQSVQLTRADRAGRSTLNGNSLAVFAPRVDPGTQHTSRPGRVGQTINHPTFNRGDSIDRPLDVTSTVRPVAPSAEAIASAREARQHVSPQARVANENTAIQSPITTPLTSMQPVEQRHHRDTNGNANNASPTPGGTHPNGGNTVNSGNGNAPFTSGATQPAAVKQPQAVVAPGSENSALTGERHNPQPVVHSQGEPTQTAPGQQPFHQQHTDHSGQASQPQSETHNNNGGGQANNPQEEFRPSQQPQTQGQGSPSFHPQHTEHSAANTTPATETAPAPTVHEQHVQQPAAVMQPQKQTPPPQVFHPQHTESPAPAQSFHPQSSPAPSSHPQTEQRTAPSTHTQNAPQHEASAPQSHPQAAPAAAPHAAPAAQGGGNKGANENGATTPQNH